MRKRFEFRELMFMRSARELFKRTTTVLSLVSLVVSFCAYPAIVRAENVEVNHGYTYDYEIESWDNYSESFGVTHDSENNVYVLGRMGGTVDMDLTAGTDNVTAQGVGYNMFIQRINADGSYGWTKTWQVPYPSTIQVDSSDQIVVAFQYSGTVDFDPGAGTDSKSSSGGSFDMGLVRIDTSGAYIDGYSMGGAGIDYPQDIAIDASNNVYLAGRFTGTCDFDPSGATDNKVSSGHQDIFVTKLNANGTYGFTETIGSAANSEQAYQVEVDSQGNIYYGGFIGGTVDFDHTGGTDSKTATDASYDIFLTKINSDRSYGFTYLIGSTGMDYLNSIKIDSQDNVILGGSFVGTVDFDPSGATDSKVTAGGGGSDSYITKINNDGSYGYTRTWGSSSATTEYTFSIDIDSDDNIYTQGVFVGTVDFDPGGGTNNHTTDSGGFFISKFSSAGDHQYALTHNVTGAAYVYEMSKNVISVDNNSDIYFTSTYADTVDLDFTAGSEDFFTSAEDIFLAKIDQTILHQITNLDPSLTAKTLSDTDATDNTIERDTTETIRLSTADSVPLADVDTTFSTDLDWSTVTADTDPDTGKTFVHNLTAADGTSGTYTLYVPKLPAHNTVGVCPGASSLAALAATCTDIYYLTEGDDTLTTTTIDGTEYWAISGLTGTGAFGLTATDTATDTDTLAETGQGQHYVLMLAVCLLVLGVGIKSRVTGRNWR